MARATEGVPRLTIVGSYAVGLTLRTDRFPAPGETVLGGDFDRGPGGKGSNQAIQAARLGASVDLIASVGSDEFGDAAVELYRHEGVGTDHLVRSARTNTGVGFIVLSAEGENVIILDPGANQELSDTHLAAATEAFRRSSVVVAQLEIPASTALRAMELGREAGATTVLNPAPAQPLPPDRLHAVDVLTPNAVELRTLLGVTAEADVPELEMCRSALELGVGAVVLTRGPRGALVVEADGEYEVPALKVDAVDTTGAGDAFTACLSVELAAGKTLEESVQLASVAGAHACLRLGVVPSLGTRRDLLALQARLIQR